MFSNLKPKQSYRGFQESWGLTLSSELNPEDCWHQLKSQYIRTSTVLVHPAPSWVGCIFCSWGGHLWGTFERQDWHRSIKCGHEKRSSGLWVASWAQAGHHSWQSTMHTCSPCIPATRHTCPACADAEMLPCQGAGDTWGHCHFMSDTWESTKRG